MISEGKQNRGKVRMEESLGKRRSSSLYRTAEDVRRGHVRSFPSLDGAKEKKRVLQRPVYESFQDRVRKYIVQKKQLLNKEALLVFMGRRGLITALFLGMLSMGMLSYIFGGRGALAENTTPVFLASQQRVLGVATENGDTVSIVNREVFERDLQKMLKGYPIADMIPYIVQQDKRVASYLVAIAKKESDWGKHIPVYYGENCFNYWGYRGQDEIMGSAGHTCFDTPKEAVSTVAKRLNRLVIEQGLTTASELIVWKCGFSCAAHDPYGVSKWISDVAGYYEKVFAMGK